MLAGLHAWVRIHFYCIWTFKAAYSYRLVVLSIYSSPQLVLVCTRNFSLSMLKRWYRCSGHQEDVQGCWSWKARHTHPDDSWPMTMGPFTTKSAILPFCTLRGGLSLTDGAAHQLYLTHSKSTQNCTCTWLISLYICHVPFRTVNSDDVYCDFCLLRPFAMLSVWTIGVLCTTKGV